MPVEAEPSPPVLAGVDVLRVSGQELPASLRGRRLGLITNHTGRAIGGSSTLSVLRDALRLKVTVLFSPEHGFTGDVAAGDVVSSGVSDGIRVESLYGATRKPTPAMLAGVDTLVFDIQDIGVRFYTYISTLKLAMEAAAEADIAFVVLDRPNPLGGTRVEGPVLDAELASFVGIAPIPLVHGMTVGELALLFRATTPGMESLALDIVRADWSRSGWTGPWIAPSPNIPSVQAALAYPALGLIEGINVSEGRGTEAPFERIGAPWIDGEALANALAKLELPGVFFEAVSFTPRKSAAAPRPKFVDQSCHGVQVTIHESDGSRYEAVRTGLEIIATIRSLHPGEFSWVENDGRFWIDSLTGTRRIRLGIDDAVPVAEILAREEPALDAFRRLRSKHLLYR